MTSSHPKAGSDGALVYRNTDGSYVQYIKASTAAPPGGLVPYDIGGGGQRIIVMSKSENGSSWYACPCVYLVFIFFYGWETKQQQNLQALRHGVEAILL